MAENGTLPEPLLPDDILLARSALPINLNSLESVRASKKLRADEAYEQTAAAALDQELVGLTEAPGSLTLLMSLNDFMGAMDLALGLDLEIPLYWCGTDLRPKRYRSFLFDSGSELEAAKAQELLKAFRWSGNSLPFEALATGKWRLVVDASIRVAEADVWKIVNLARTCPVAVIGFTSQHNRESRYAAWMPTDAMLLLAHCAQRLGFCFTGNYALTHHVLWVKHPDPTLVASDWPKRETIYGGTDDDIMTEVGGWF